MSMRGSKVFELFLHFKQRTIEQKKKERNMITCRATCTDTKDFLSEKKLKQKMFDHKLTLTHQQTKQQNKRKHWSAHEVKNYGSLFEMLFKIRKMTFSFFDYLFFILEILNWPFCIIQMRKKWGHSYCFTKTFLVKHFMESLLFHSHIIQTLIYLRQQKKIIQKRKRHSSLFRKAFQIRSNYFFTL